MVGRFANERRQSKCAALLQSWYGSCVCSSPASRPFGVLAGITAAGELRDIWADMSARRTDGIPTMCTRKTCTNFEERSSTLRLPASVCKTTDHSSCAPARCKADRYLGKCCSVDSRHAEWMGCRQRTRTQLLTPSKARAVRFDCAHSFAKRCTTARAAPLDVCRVSTGACSVEVSAGQRRSGCGASFCKRMRAIEAHCSCL